MVRRMNPARIITFRLFISNVFLILCGLQKLANFLVFGHTQVFSSAENDLKYLIDDATNSHISSLIKFTPESLDFHEHSVGVPYIEKVIVENKQEDASVQMLSISGNTVHFHCSFFEDKIIPPLGNTSFEVVFLARQEGFVNNTLYIHTSLGSLRYQVSAIGTANPYRLRPFVGARVPLNSSYAPLIHIYNPHGSTLQLTEMYTTGGGLHLELPNGDSEMSKEFWQIPPYETKTIMRANFLARSEKNHTAYIRIKMNCTDAKRYVILPVEVEVSSSPGLYTPIALIDFGVMRTLDMPKKVIIQVLNSGSKQILIQNVIATPVNDALQIDFNAPVRVVPDVFHFTDIATVTLHPDKIQHSLRQCNGKIVIKSKNNQYKLAIPYTVKLLQGKLEYNATQTQFHIQSVLKNEKRNLVISNKFNVTIFIHSIILPDEAKPYFKVSLMKTSMVLRENASEPVVKIVFTPSTQLFNLQTFFRLQTNISYFDIALHAYSGKLEVFIPHSTNQTVLDFGAIGLGEQKSMNFAVINSNPVDVRIKHWGCNMSKAYVELMGNDEGDANALAYKIDYANLNRKNITNLKPKYFAMFNLHLTGFDKEGLYYGENFVETPFETLKIPFVLRAVDGNFISEKVLISNCFPGRISSQSVRVSSTFAHDLKFKSAQIIPEDDRFTFEGSQTHVKFGDNTLGKLYFDPIKGCGKTCYSGLDTSKEVGHLWLLGLALHSDTGYIDKELHKLLFSRWTNMQHLNKTVNATLQLEVDGISHFTVDARVTFNWPRLTHKSHIKFPITRIGSLATKEVLIENPASQSILVQVVLLSDYPNAEAAIQLLKSGFHTVFSDSELNSVETKPKSFQLIRPSGEDSRNNSHKLIKDSLGVTPDPHSISLLMPVGARAKISLGFTPKDDSSIASTILLIRNNLTILEAIHLQGQGGNGLLKIGNQLPDLKSALSFELLDKHLKSCMKGKSQGSYAIEPTFTVHRTFTAVNVGKLTMKIQGFSIGSQTSSTSFECQGFGFKVINCAGFDLRPNENKKIHIAFTPDFTLSKVSQVLTIHTDDPNEKLQYALVATLPKHLLPHCNDALPRPQWEAVLYYCLLTMMAFIVFLAICIAFFDGDRILNYSFYPILTSYSAVPPGSNISTSESTPEEIDVTYMKSNGINEDAKNSKKNQELRQRKTKTKNRSGSNVKDETVVENGQSYYQGQTWTQFLRKKFVRRDSSGSDKSNNSSRSQQQSATKTGQQNDNNKRQNEIITNEEKQNSKKTKKGSNQKENEPKAVNKKKVNTAVKHEDQNLTNVVRYPPPPLPSFPSAFDNDDVAKNNKNSKKPKSNTVSSDSLPLELPYKPGKSALNGISNNKNVVKKKKEERVPEDRNDAVSCVSNSSDNSSIIWDSPITVFDSDHAMNELVRQTEMFAEKSTTKQPLKPQRSNPIGSLLQPRSFNNGFNNWSVDNSTSLFRSATPPASTSTWFDESLLERRTPPSFPSYMERPAPVPADPWLTDITSSPTTNSLDHELTRLRETSSPWNSNAQNQSSLRLKDWQFSDDSNSKNLWENSKWPTTSSHSNQSLWSESFSSGLWDSTKRNGTQSSSNRWGDSFSLTNTLNHPSSSMSDELRNAASTSPSSSNTITSSPFNLFGQSLWNPISATATAASAVNDNNEANNTTTTNQTTPSASTWSFTPFSLFGSTQAQFQRK